MVAIFLRLLFSRKRLNLDKLATGDRNTWRSMGRRAQNTVEKAMHKFKKGELKSGKSGSKVKSRKQAVAIGLSEAREKGAKVPKK
jgi:hypothetical protein